MSYYNFMVQKIPYILQNDNNLKLIKTISESFDKTEDTLNSLNGVWRVTEATGEYLDVIGQNVGVKRKLNQTDDIYRRRIKIALYNLYFVPIFDNFLDFIKNIIGYYPENVEIPNETGGESGVINLSVVVPTDEDKEFLTNFDTVYSAGIRLIWEELQEVFAEIQGLGEDYPTGLNDVFDITERRTIPIYRTYREIQGLGEDYPTGVDDLYDISEGVI